MDDFNQKRAYSRTQKASVDYSEGVYPHQSSQRDLLEDTQRVLNDSTLPAPEFEANFDNGDSVQKKPKKRYKIVKRKKGKKKKGSGTAAESSIIDDQSSFGGDRFRTQQNTRGLTEILTHAPTSSMDRPVDHGIQEPDVSLSPFKESIGIKSMLNKLNDYDDHDDIDRSRHYNRADQSQGKLVDFAQNDPVGISEQESEGPLEESEGAYKQSVVEEEDEEYDDEKDGADSYYEEEVSQVEAEASHNVKRKSFAKQSSNLQDLSKQAIKDLKDQLRQDYEDLQVLEKFSQNDMYQEEKRATLEENRRQSKVKNTSKKGSRGAKLAGGERTNQDKLGNQNDDDTAATWNLSDTDEEEYKNYPSLARLSKAKRDARMLVLWKTVINFAFSASIFITQLAGLQQKIQIFGQQLVAMQSFKKDAIQGSWYIMMPDSTFKTFWNLSLIVALLYTATVMPYNVAFIEEDPPTLAVTNFIVDTFFWFDLIFSFVSAFERPNGKLEVRFTQIAKNYLLGWFTLDFISTFPTQVFEDIFAGDSDGNSVKANKLARILRLPRLYRLARLMRILRVLKLLRYNKRFRVVMNAINISNQSQQMLQISLSVFIVSHIVSCLWFFFAKLDNLGDGTWVTRKGIPEDESLFFLYCTSQYWTLQVLTTVGFGDFGAGTITEYIFNVLWMLGGVGLYQLLFGQIISIIQSSMLTEDQLTGKLKSLEEFKNEVELDSDLYFNIRMFLMNNYNEIQEKQDEQEFLSELPLALRDELFFTQFGEKIEKIDLLRESDDNEFTWELISKAQKVTFSKDEVIYQQDDFADQVYMIYEGQVGLSMENGMSVAAYNTGDIIGDQDALLNENRDAKCTALAECEFYAIHVEQLQDLLKKSPTMERKMISSAREKRMNHQKIITKLEKQFPVYGIKAISNGDEPLTQAQKTALLKLKSYGVPVKAEALEDGKGAAKYRNQHFDNMMEREDIRFHVEEYHTNFDMKQITEDNIKVAKEFIEGKFGADNLKMVSDAEFVREVTILLGQNLENLTQKQQEEILQGVLAIKNEFVKIDMPQEGAPPPAIESPAKSSALTRRFGNALKNSLPALQTPMSPVAGSPSKTAESPKIDIAIKKKTIEQVMEYQRLVEQDESLGMPEAQAAMEVINGLNADMAKIAGNMQMLVHSLDNLNKVQQDNLWRLEAQTIKVVDKQQKIMDHTDLLFEETLALMPAEPEQKRPSLHQVSPQQLQLQVTPQIQSQIQIQPQVPSLPIPILKNSASVPGGGGQDPLNYRSARNQPRINFGSVNNISVNTNLKPEGPRAAAVNNGFFTQRQDNNYNGVRASLGQVSINTDQKDDGFAMI